MLPSLVSRDGFSVLLIEADSVEVKGMNSCAFGFRGGGGTLLGRWLGGATPISSLVVRHGNMGVTGPGHIGGLVLGVPTQVSHTLSVSLVSLASPISNAGRVEVQR